MPVRSLAGAAQPGQGSQGRPARTVAVSPDRGREQSGRQQNGAGLPSDDEFLDRYGDALDDRVAEILDELLTERDSARQPWRLTFVLGMASLLLVAAATNVMLRHEPMAWVIWSATAVICLRTAWAAPIRRRR